MHVPAPWHSDSENSGYIEVLDMGTIIPSEQELQQQHMYRILSDDRIADEDLQSLVGGSNASWIYRHEVYLFLTLKNSLPG